MDKVLDIVVIGGGMAGLAFASALKDAPVSILLVDPQAQPSPEKWPGCFDPRVSALSVASETLLQNVGAWELMASQRFCPYRHMDVWDGDGTGKVQFDTNELATDHLGHIVENRVTQWALYQCVLQQANVSFVESSLQSLRPLINGWQVSLSNGDCYRPALVVGADGGRSLAREQAGFHVRAWPYHHRAIVTTVKTEKTHQHTARQRFMTTGPLAFLPLCEKPNAQGDADTGQYSSIVWSLDSDEAEAVMALNDTEFKRQLGRAFEYRLGEILETDMRYSFPLVQQHASHYIQPGLALIGDAAHTIHPLAGQGINLGFMDAAVLAEEVALSTHRGLCPGERMGLRRYERRRKTHNLTTMGAMEGFKRLFEPLNWWMTSVRNEGMNQFNRHNIAKRKVVSQAMGLEGDLPKIARTVSIKKMDEKTAG
ncbi:MAG: FAD-dependent monooxygenase [Pseudomonadales bacterium]|nr:FAD-dependent monooxygenase [Pseudomonadales bacterium]